MMPDCTSTLALKGLMNLAIHLGEYPIAASWSLALEKVEFPSLKIIISQLF